MVLSLNSVASPVKRKVLVGQPVRDKALNPS